MVLPYDKGDNLSKFKIFALGAIVQFDFIVNIRLGQFFNLLWRPRFVPRIHLKSFWPNGMEKNDFLGPLSASEVF